MVPTGIVEFLVDSFVSAIALFGVGTALTAVILLVAYQYFRLERRKRRERRYSWR